MLLAAAQLPVRMDVTANLRDLSAAIVGLPPHTFVVAPEGALSGYLPEAGLTGRLDDTRTWRAIEEACRLVAEAQLHLVVGACVKVDSVWRNSAFYMGPAGELQRYDKINLAMSPRGGPRMTFPQD
ncbi:hypothetical protein [Phenylobacterium immobile]|uniref:hypothetical protein n=1 Tax=Phenylobacterium immobile TaxID=21 RepID=UPI000A796C4A|nr:hypothetical protein [Phenylobacterium immobile]